MKKAFAMLCALALSFPQFALVAFADEDGYSDPDIAPLEAYVEEAPEVDPEPLGGEGAAPVGPGTVGAEDAAATEDASMAAQAPEGEDDASGQGEESQAHAPAVTSQGSGSGYIDVVEDYGASNDGTANARNAINAALAQGKSKDGCEQTTVYIPAGTYIIDRPLLVFSNTTLQLDQNAEILFSPSGAWVWTMAIGAHFGPNGAIHSDLNQSSSGCSEGGYSQISNITIDGGRWDCGGVEGKNKTQAFQFRHGTNITLRNAVVENPSFHAINLSGTQNTLVDNVTIRNAVSPHVEGRDDGSYETIHLDFMDEVGEPTGRPFDNTAPKNVTIRNCTFDKVFAGIGTGHESKTRSVGIVVQNCTFKDIGGGICVKLPSCDGAIVEGCTLNAGATHFVRVWDSSKNIVISGNVVRNTGMQGIAVTEHSSATVVNNLVVGAGRNDADAGVGIHIRNSDGTVSNNVVHSCALYGICVNGHESSNSATVSDNTATWSEGRADIFVGNTIKSGVVRDNHVGSRGCIIQGESGVSSSNNDLSVQSAKWVRVWGNSAYETMETVSSLGWVSERGGTVIVATGANYPDALAAAGVAGLENAPVLITDPNSLSAATERELARLKPSKVIVVGGIYAVSDKVKNQIASASGAKEVERIAGDSASDTAAILNSAYAGSWAGTAILATRLSFQDALSVAPVSYAQGMPIFLVDDMDTISQATIDAMKECSIENIMVVGGKFCVSDAVKTKLGEEGLPVVDTLAGDSAYDTSQAIARWGINNGMTAARMGVACGTNYPDALTGAAFCGKNNSVLVLADSRNQSCSSVASSNKDKLVMGYVFGGKYAVPEKVFERFDSATK